MYSYYGRMDTIKPKEDLLKEALTQMHTRQTEKYIKNIIDFLSDRVQEGRKMTDSKYKKMKRNQAEVTKLIKLISKILDSVRLIARQELL